MGQCHLLAHFFISYRYREIVMNISGVHWTEYFLIVNLGGVSGAVIGVWINLKAESLRLSRSVAVEIIMMVLTANVLGAYFFYEQKIQIHHALAACFGVALGGKMLMKELGRGLAVWVRSKFTDNGTKRDT